MLVFLWCVSVLIAFMFGVAFASEFDIVERNPRRF